MEKHRASWKAESCMRRKGHSPDRFQVVKKMPGTGDSQGSHSPRRALSDKVRPLDRQAKLLDSDASVTPELEKSKGTLSEQDGQRSHHKDKTHKKGQHGFLKALVNFLTKTGSEEQREKGEKKPKEKCNSPQDPKHLEAFVDPPEPTFGKKDKEKGDKTWKEKSIFPQGLEPPEVLAEPLETISKKKDKERVRKKSKEKCISPQNPEPLETLAEPPETISKKKDKERVRKKSKEKSIFPQGPEPPEALAEPLETISKKKDKERVRKKSKEKSIFPQGLEPPEALAEPLETISKKKDKERVRKKSKEKSIFPQGPEPPEALAEPPKPTSKKKEKKSSLKKAFSFKKHGHEEAKKSSGLDSRSPEARRPTKPTFLPLCFSHRPASLTIPDPDEKEAHEALFMEVGTLDSTGLSSQVGWPPPKEQPPSNRLSEPDDIIIQKIVALLKEQGDKYNEKIKEDSSLGESWDSISFSSIQTLADALVNQEENQKKSDGSPVDRHYHLTNKYAGNTNHAVHRIMGWRDHVVTHTFGHIPYNNEQHGTSTPFLSPD